MRRKVVAYLLFLGVPMFLFGVFLISSHARHDVEWGEVPVFVGVILWGIASLLAQDDE